MKLGGRITSNIAKLPTLFGKDGLSVGFGGRFAVDEQERILLPSR
jgi:hypothetical protein